MAGESLTGFRLSPPQRRLWRLAAASGPEPFQAVCLLRLPASPVASGWTAVHEVPPGRLARWEVGSALARMVARHDILRTGFQQVAGASLPLQAPLPAGGELELAVVDLSSVGGAPLGLTEPPGPPHPFQPPGAPQSEIERLWQRVRGVSGGCPPSGSPAPEGQDAGLAAVLILLGGGERLLLLRLSALRADAASLDLLAAELVAACALEAAPHGDPPYRGGVAAASPTESAREEPGQAPPLPYAQVAEWLNGLREEEGAAEARAFWQRLGLARVPPLALPWSDPEAAPRAFAPRLLAPHSSSASGSGRLAACLAGAPSAAREAGVPVEVFLLAVWQALLCRLAGREEVVSGRLVEGRDHELLAGVCGPLSQVLPLGVPCAPHDTAAGLARRVAEWLEETADWQDGFTWEAAFPPSAAPGAGEAAAGPEPAETTGVPAWFAAGFACRRAPCPAVVRSFACTERLDLLLTVLRPDGEAAAGWGLEVLFDTARLRAGDARLAATLFANLVAAAAAAPRAPLGDLPLLSAAERTELLAGAGGANGRRHPALGHGPLAGAGPEERPLARLFEEQVARTPHRLAVVEGGDGGAALSYAELDARANRLARRLRELGIGPEIPVGLLLERSADQLVALWAVLKAGGVLLPLDPRQPRARLAAILAQAGAPLVICRGPRRPLRPLRPLRTTAEELSGLTGQPEAAGAQRPEAAEAAEAGGSPALPFPLDLATEEPKLGRLPAGTLKEGPALPDNLAYVLFTSGSTGQPKGVMVAQRSVVRLASGLAGAVAGAPAGDGGAGVSLNAPLTFDSSVKQWLRLLSGDTLHLVPEEVRLDPGRFIRLVGERGLGVVDCTPTQLRGLLAAGFLSPGEPGGPQEAAPGLVLVGGEAIDPATWRRLVALAERGPSRCYNVYGPTECTVDATACPLAAEGGAGAGGPSLGLALAHVSCYLLDPFALGRGLFEPAPPGVAGELFIGGGGVGRGYLGRPELTAERFLPDPFAGEPGARLYRTGDLARIARAAGGGGHALEFLGRRDSQVKVRGFRIELGEIETVLATHPAVVQAAVVLRREGRGGRAAGVAAAAATQAPAPGPAPASAPPEMTGEGPELVAYVVPRAAALPPGGDGDPGELRDWLRRRLPAPMVPARWVFLGDLPRGSGGKVDRGALPDPDLAAPAPRRAPHVAPRNQAERAVAAIWQEVLGVPVVGVDDNFFDLGGHSLLMVRAHGRLQESFGRELSLVDLFRHATVGALAAFLVAGEADGLSRSELAERAGHRQQELERQRGDAERQRAALDRARGLR